jgi:hypothetical protein
MQILLGRCGERIAARSPSHDLRLPTCGGCQTIVKRDRRRYGGGRSLSAYWAFAGILASASALDCLCAAGTAPGGETGRSTDAEVAPPG